MRGNLGGGSDGDSGDHSGHVNRYLNGLVVFPTFFNLSLNLEIRSSWSEPQSGPGLVFADCIELLHLWLGHRPRL